LLSINKSPIRKARLNSIELFCWQSNLIKLFYYFILITIQFTFTLLISMVTDYMITVYLYDYYLYGYSLYGYNLFIYLLTHPRSKHSAPINKCRMWTLIWASLITTNNSFKIKEL
jgi:hypothetical protein